MEALGIVGLALVAVAILVFLRPQKPEIALLLSATVGATIFLALAGRIAALLVVLEAIGDRARMNPLYVGTVLKIIGIAYITEFGAQLCRDANEGAIANKVEMAGKVFILLLAVPIILAVVELILKLLP